VQALKEARVLFGIAARASSAERAPAGKIDSSVYTGRQLSASVLPHWSLGRGGSLVQGS